MDLLTQALAAAADDPVLLAGAVLVAWAPACAAGLGLLAGLAALQCRFGSRPKRRPALLLPPVEVRPLAARRVLTTPSRRFDPVTAARLVVAIGAVVGFSALLLVASGTLLLAALRS
jgi:hypothetical protein